MLTFSESGNLSVLMTLPMEFTPWFSRNLMTAGKLFQTIQISCRMVELKRKKHLLFYNSTILKSSASFKKGNSFLKASNFCKSNSAKIKSPFLIETSVPSAKKQ